MAMLKYTIEESELYDGSAALTMFDAIRWDAVPSDRNYKAVEPLEHFEDAKASPLPMVFTFILAAVICILMLSQYIMLRTNVVNTTNEIATMKATLSTMTESNNEEYHDILEQIDYNEIRRVAIQDLHMIVPETEQVVYVDYQTNDYVRQYSDIK